MTPHPLLKPLQSDPTQHGQHGGWTLEAEQAQADTVGIRTDGLHLTRKEPSARDASSLARDLAGRASYLLEPLTLVEGSEQKALLRSQITESPDEGQPYYEMWVTPDELSLRRYEGQRGQSRRPRPVSLTWEQAERLVKDVEATYAAEPPEE
jgi:hypothetical protein